MSSHCVKVAIGPAAAGLLLLLRSALAVALPLAPVAASESLELTVVIENVRSDSGQVRVAFWSDEAGFPDGDFAAREDAARAARGEVAFRFADLAPGRYAFAVYHDENDNGDFDLTWIGLPDEGLGFSNGARIFFGPPSFAAAAVELAAGVQTVRIALRY